jgi:hypothetical protein
MPESKSGALTSLATPLSASHCIEIVGAMQEENARILVKKSCKNSGCFALDSRGLCLLLILNESAG